MAEIVPTRSAALALADERRLIHQGYDFLDEKRMLLAGELLRQLRRYEGLLEDYRSTTAIAAQAMSKALQRHGLDGLQSYPPAIRTSADIAAKTISFLGVMVTDAHCEAGPPVAAFAPVDGSEAAESCRMVFSDLVALAVELAAASGNVRRLLEDYRRTERRARALENVLLPDIDRSLKEIEEHLEAVDQEEAIRVRKAKPAV